jgi:putative inorganic carbon (HCO3(-)) transporter
MNRSVGMHYARREKLSMRVLITLLITFIGGYLSFYNAFYGLLAYSFWSYAYPDKLTWGRLPLKGLGFIIGLVLVVTTIMQRNKVCSDNRKIAAILIFLALCLCAVFTSGQDLARYQFQYFSKVILVTLIITLLVDDLERFYNYVWGMAIFIGFIAATSGFKGMISGQIGGAAKGLSGVFNDRNFMAVFLCAVIPIVFYLVNIEKKKRLKLFLIFVLVGDVLALILTYSRAGFLGLSAVVVFAFMKSRNKFVIAVSFTIALYFAINFVVPQAYVDRMQTMKKIDSKQEDADNSAIGRLIAWRAALNMMEAKPLTGVGFYNSQECTKDYAAADPAIKKFPVGIAVHNSLLQVGSEVGVPAFILYISIFFVNYRTLGKVSRKVKLFNLSADIDKYASMLQMAFVGFFVSGFFVNAAFLDISWSLVGLSIALEQIANREIEEKEANEVSVDAA